MLNEYQVALANVQATNLCITLGGLEMPPEWGEFVVDLGARLNAFRVKLTEMEALANQKK